VHEKVHLGFDVSNNLDRTFVFWGAKPLGSP